MDQSNDQAKNVGKQAGGWVCAAVAGALLMYAFDPSRGAARRARARGALRDAGQRTGEQLEHAWHGAEARFDTARVRASHAYARAGERLADAAHKAGDRLSSASSQTRDRLEHARDRVADASYKARDRVADASHHARDRVADASHHARDRVADASYEARERAAHAAGYAADKAREHSARASHKAHYRAHEAQERASELAANVAETARERVGNAYDRAAGSANDLYHRADSAARSQAHAVGDQLREWGGHLSHLFGSRSPTLTNSALLGTGALSVVGLVRRSPVAALLGLGALAVLLRSDRGRHLVDSLRARGAGSASQVEVENTIHIDASPKEVYDAWADVENFPRFMSHVTEVRDLGHRRSHWSVRGPGGLEYAWNAVMTEQSRPDRLSWRSEPGSEIEQEGTVSFEPSRGGTLVTVRMRYAPPAGVLGHGIARMLGTDPQRQMDDDLARMKSFIERGGSQYAAQQPAPDHSYLH